MEASMDSKFIEISEEIISQPGFKNVKEFVKSHALLMIMAKIEKYEMENKYFEKKYQAGFAEFRTKIEKRENSEDFTEEDDYLDWRFAIENLARLRKQQKELDNA